jgi:hypothetical protein
MTILQSSRTLARSCSLENIRIRYSSLENDVGSSLIGLQYQPIQEAFLIGNDQILDANFASCVDQTGTASLNSDSLIIALLEDRVLLITARETQCDLL